MAVKQADNRKRQTALVFSDDELKDTMFVISIHSNFAENPRCESNHDGQGEKVLIKSGEIFFIFLVQEVFPNYYQMGLT